jgi:hypothetical protein
MKDMVMALNYELQFIKRGKTENVIFQSGNIQIKKKPCQKIVKRTPQRIPQRRMPFTGWDLSEPPFILYRMPPDSGWECWDF